jgi:hypothetical protein
LVLVFQESAWQALGKVQHPQSGKSEVNLPLASHAIDMLAMLEAKTKGNLSDAERQLLANALTQLRLNYVDVAAGQTQSKSESKPQSDSGK